MSILATILESKAREVDALDPAGFPTAPGPARGFEAALRTAADRQQGGSAAAGTDAGAGAPRPPRMALIAEIKRRSPSRPLIRADFDPPAMARAYARGGATALSVLTDGPFFGGSLADLAAVRTAVDLPLLRKDFLIDARQLAQARAHGADAALLIAAALDDATLAALLAEARRLGLDALVEVHAEDELDRALAAGATLVGVNNRNLATFQVDLGTTERIARRLAASGATDRVLLVSESGIATPADRKRLEACGAAAMLVGEALLAQADLEAAARALLG